MMKLYCGIDLHSNNGMYGIVDEQGKRVYKKRLINNLPQILSALSPYQENISEIAIESTYNWYWLGDGLMANGYRGKLRLANPAALDQYDGLKNANDETDAFFLAELLRLGILASGYIYPQAERPVRDMLRRRVLFVRQRTAQMLSLQNLLTRQSGQNMRFQDVLKLSSKEFVNALGDEESMFMARQNMDVIRFLSEKIKILEKRVLKKAELKPAFEKLLTIPGIGTILGMTIMMETGEISRFPKCGNYSSYCRCVKAQHLSNNKKKSNNNRKNGNKYLSWAFIEAASKCIMFCPEARSFYDRKRSKGPASLAFRSLGSKLSKAAYFIMRDQEEFDVKKIFG